MNLHEGYHPLARIIAESPCVVSDETVMNERIKTWLREKAEKINKILDAYANRRHKEEFGEGHVILGLSDTQPKFMEELRMKLHELAQRVRGMMPHAFIPIQLDAELDSIIRTYLEEKAKELNKNIGAYSVGERTVEQIIGLSESQVKETCVCTSAPSICKIHNLDKPVEDSKMKCEHYTFLESTYGIPHYSQFRDLLCPFCPPRPKPQERTLREVLVERLKERCAGMVIEGSEIKADWNYILFEALADIAITTLREFKEK